MDDNQLVTTTTDTDDDEESDDLLTLLAMYDWYTRLVLMTGIFISSTGIAQNDPISILKLNGRNTLINSTTIHNSSSVIYT
jgi:hypothetical protein